MLAGPDATHAKQLPHRAWDATKTIFKEWKRDDCLQWGAALAFYAVFSLAPILIIIFAVAGLVLDENIVQERIFEETEALLGSQGAEFISGLTDRAMATGGSTLAIGIGAIVLLVGATGAFAQLSIALNRIWGIRATPKRGWLRLIKKRVLSLGFVLVVGLLLMISLLADAALSVVAGSLDAHGAGLKGLVSVLSRVVLLGLAALLFALVFHYLPDARISWRSVWPGAILTALLFEVGKFLFRFYIGHAAVASEFGAAGSLVLILVWVWFASQIVFIGAETNQVLARRRGEPIRPEEHAERVRRTGDGTDA